MNRRRIGYRAGDAPSVAPWAPKPLGRARPSIRRGHAMASLPPRPAIAPKPGKKEIVA